jgi:hypothetical protein
MERPKLQGYRIPVPGDDVRGRQVRTRLLGKDCGVIGGHKGDARLVASVQLLTKRLLTIGADALGNAEMHSRSVANGFVRAGDWD